MPYHYTKESLIEALVAIGLKKGDVVFSHSNIGFLGLPEYARTKADICDLILEAIFTILGTEGTLVMPTFTYSFCKQTPFDPDLTPSDCGALSEHLRLKEQSIRSHDPNVSVVAQGKLARFLTEKSPENTYHETDSFFSKFLEQNGVICNINFDAGSTFIHYVERQLKVPYRFDKSFVGEFCYKGKSEQRKSTLWVRQLEGVDTTAEFTLFDRLARTHHCFVTQKVGRGFVGLITAQNTFKLIQEFLPAHPWLLTKHGLKDADISKLFNLEAKSSA